MPDVIAFETDALDITLDRGDVVVAVRAAGRRVPLLVAPQGGARLRTTRDVPLRMEGAGVVDGGLAFTLRGNDAELRVALTATEARAVRVDCEAHCAPGAEVEWLWCEWLFQPEGRPLERPPRHAWTPNLRPEPHHVIGDHCFRSAVLSVADDEFGVLLLPDLALQAAAHPLRFAFDYRADGDFPLLSYGAIACQPEEHMYFGHVDGQTQVVPSGVVRFGYVLRMWDRSLDATGPLVVAARSTWQSRPDRREATVAPQVLPWADYARAAYPEIVRHHFVHTPEAGPDTGGVPHWIYPDYIAFQCWFNNLRSGYGLCMWGDALGEAEWSRAGRAMRRLWEAAPCGDGVFAPTYYKPATNEWCGVSDLSAFGPAFVEAFGDPGLLRWYATTDACWTHLWRLRWMEELDGDASLPADTAALADRLAREQAPDGAVPSFFDAHRFTPGDTLRKSAETALPVWLWVEALRREPRAGWLEAARVGAQFLRDAVIPQMRYFDYETFHSCSRKPEDFEDAFTGIAPHNTLSMQWTAEALLGLWRLTGERQWLDAALEALACLSLYQQVWNAPFLSYDTYGGFGVMNTDAEWSDARQAQFARTLLRFAEATGDREPAERGVAALRASFALMALPENAAVSPATYRGECPNWPAEHRLRMFAPELAGRYDRMPTGHMVENYGHTGLDTPGVRTAFDWGEGSALSAAAEIARNYGDVWVNTDAGWAIGIDGWLATAMSSGAGALTVHIRDGLGRPRDCTIGITGAGRSVRLTDGPALPLAHRLGRAFARIDSVAGSMTVHVG